MSSIEKALSQNRSVYNTAHNRALSVDKATLSGLVDLAPSEGLGQLGLVQSSTANQQRYTLFRGWIYAAVHALAQEGAGQPVNLGRLSGKRKTGKGRSNPGRIKLPSSIRHKTADEEFDIVTDHPLLSALERPNPIQDRWQFVYSFIANLCLTGWAFIVGGEKKDEEGYELYVLPTTWVKPDHSKGAFSQFRIVNPKNPSASLDAKPLDRSQVAFAYLPNPSDPLSALAPASAEMNAIKIDDYIQTSQQAFFKNGIFPSVIITVGKNPHPDAGAFEGRPRLSGPQRRQVYAAIRKVTGGVANYGNPAIIDGLIEKIERLSATQNEMGWDRSENKVRSRILSAFGVHPFILGEMTPGSYAQAYNVESRFCKRVNTFLDLLGNVLTNFSPNLVSEENLLIWWELCQAVDPQLEQRLWTEARKNDDISQNELRAYMGLPPDDDRNESVINKQALAAVSKIAADANMGNVSVEQAKGILIGMGISDDLAEQIAGDGISVKPEQPKPAIPVQQTEEGEDEGGDNNQSIDVLEAAIDLIRVTPKDMANYIVNQSKYNPSQPRIPAGSPGGG